MVPTYLMMAVPHGGFEGVGLALVGLGMDQEPRRQPYHHLLLLAAHGTRAHAHGITYALHVISSAAAPADHRRGVR